MKKHLYASLLFLLCLTTACQDGPQLKSNAGGKAGEVVVVFDQPLWDSTFSKQIKQILAADYPLLPQREPLFNVITIPSTSFSNVFKLHRNLVFVQLTPDSIPDRIIVKHDVWAQPQTIVRINGTNSSEILRLADQEQERLLNILENAEHDRVINNSKKYEARYIRDTLNRIFGGSPYFPDGCHILKKREDFVWINYPTSAKLIQNIFVYKYPYKDSTSFRLHSLITARNEMLKREVPGQFDSTYMTTATAEPPVSRSLLYNNIHFVEVRGLWDIEGDYMGGPFISHSFLDQSGKNIICLEAFVYNPRSDKRELLRLLEGILYSFQWTDNQKPKNN